MGPVHSLISKKIHEAAFPPARPVGWDELYVLQSKYTGAQLQELPGKVPYLKICVQKTAQNKKKVLLVYAHGNAECVASVWANFVSSNFPLTAATEATEIWIWEYEGYGCRAGTAEDGVEPSQEALERDACRVAEAALQGTHFEEVLFVGFSLGTYVATASAVHFNDLLKQLKQDDLLKQLKQAEVEPKPRVGLILLSPLASVKHACPPALQPFLFGHDGFQTVEKLQHFMGPCLILHGADDTKLPVRNAQILADSCFDPRPVLHILPDTDHNGILSRDLMGTYVAEFCRQCLQPCPGRPV